MGSKIVTFLHYKSIGFAETVARTRTPDGCSNDLTYAIFHEFLCANNVRFALNGQPAFRAAIKTTFEIMTFLKEGGDISEIEDRLVSNKLFEQITQVEKYKYLQEDFLH